MRDNDHDHPANGHPASDCFHKQVTRIYQHKPSDQPARQPVCHSKPGISHQNLLACGFPYPFQAKIHPNPHPVRPVQHHHPFQNATDANGHDNQSRRTSVVRSATLRHPTTRKQRQTYRLQSVFRRHRKSPPFVQLHAATHIRP